MTMGGGSVIVPSVKSEPPSTEPPPPETETVVDKDVLCPICMQIIKDAFLTSCGHNFCYMCIVTHLQNKSDCPCCAHYLTTTHIYPNFLLNKLLMKASACQIAKGASPIEQVRLAFQQGCDVSIKELDSLLVLLTDKKRRMEQEEAESNLQIMHEFLHCLRRQKLEELNEVQNDLQYIKEDINAVERHRIELHRAKERCSVKLRMLADDSTVKTSWPSLMDKRNSSSMSLGNMAAGSQLNRLPDAQAPASSLAFQKKDTCSGSDSQSTQAGVTVARKRRVHAQFNDLQECYLQRRRHWAKQVQKQEERDNNPIKREGYHAGLKDFQSVLSTFTRYSRLRVIAELRHGDLFHSADIISSIEFDRDDELFATAGVSRRIKVFEFASVVNERADVQCPVVEMSTRSKLSCLSWNKYTKSHIASSDYEGIVTVWDVTTRQSIMEYEEHEKRAWSLDFSCTEPTMLVSGSDDCKVKIWCTRQEASVLNIEMKANICSVKYNPGSSFHVAVGSADHHIHYYDLRNISQPLHIFSGHRKAVSYVKFLSNHELASASTDSTLRLWDVKQNIPLRTFRGHVNEKNFVGLTVNSEYIACGSETNEVFVYHKAISRPAAWHGFSSDANEGEEPGSYFTSAVCWKNDSPTMITANSRGTIKVLVLAE
ncbi:WD40 repeat-containing protein [Artemisia annua]|uniref:WD40 repeat-containing protein n=1 Tax=Artemisia annua TaxID=35608 RepID=A0A2U1NID5_ARTAN|nr:WD40 repeat-containing protein [Artemisia annua]